MHTVHTDGVEDVGQLPAAVVVAAQRFGVIAAVARLDHAVDVVVGVPHRAAVGVSLAQNAAELIVGVGDEQVFVSVLALDVHLRHAAEIVINKLVARSVGVLQRINARHSAERVVGVDIRPTALGEERHLIGAVVIIALDGAAVGRSGARDVPENVVAVARLVPCGVSSREQSVALFAVLRRRFDRRSRGSCLDGGTVA